MKISTFNIWTPLFAVAVLTLLHLTAVTASSEEVAAAAAAGAGAGAAAAASVAVDKTTNEAIDVIVGTHESLLWDAQQLFRRSLQSSSSSSDPCESLYETAQSCLVANVGDVNSTTGQDCMTCYWTKQQNAIDDFRKNPTLECGSLNGNLCTPVTECACVEPCDNEISAYNNCSFITAFEQAGIDLNCSISCVGTNVSVTDDTLVNATDDFVGGLCRSEEAAVKLCLESMGSSLDQCGSCLATTQTARVSSSTTCSDLQAITCNRISTCQCVQECKTEMLAMWNCDIDFSAVDYPQLETCDKFANCDAGSGGSSSTSTSGAAPRNGAAVAALVATAAAGAVTAITTMIVQ